MGCSMHLIEKATLRSTREEPDSHPDNEREKGGCRSASEPASLHTSRMQNAKSKGRTNDMRTEKG